MSSAIYNKAFEVQLSHDFYVTSGEFSVNKLLEIVPVDASAELMKNGRMRFVRTAQGFAVFYQAYLDTVPVTEEKPLVELTGAQDFLFVIRIKNEAELLLNVTDLNIYSGMTLQKKYGAGMTYLLDGTDADLSLNASLIDQVRPQVFTYSFRGVLTGSPFTGNVTITVKNEDNTTTLFTFTDVACDPATGIFSQPLDFSGLPNGIYNIEAKKIVTPFDSVHTAELYIDNALARENVFGLIRLKYADAADLYDGEEVFTYAFPAREVLWRYYIVAKNLPADFFSTQDLTVFDENVLPITAVTFEASNPGPDGQPYGQPDSDIRINGLDTVILTSQQPIAYTEAARLNMNLFKHLHSGGDTKIASNLPNARVDGVDSDQLGAAQVPPTITENIAEIFVII